MIATVKVLTGIGTSQTSKYVFGVFTCLSYRFHTTAVLNMIDLTKSDIYCSVPKLRAEIVSIMMSSCMLSKKIHFELLT